MMYEFATSLSGCNIWQQKHKMSFTVSAMMALAMQVTLHFLKINILVHKARFFQN